MNRFGLQIWEHLVRTRPDDLSSITDPTAWFQAVGNRIEAEITTATATPPPVPISRVGSDPTATRQVVEAAVVARYRLLHPSDMLTDPTDPLPDWLTDHVAMLNREVADRQGSASDQSMMESGFSPMTRATEAWLARRSREIVVPVSMIDDPIVRRWRAAGHTITTRAV